jgi:hypothetical protein
VGAATLGALAIGEPLQFVALPSAGWQSGVRASARSKRMNDGS